MLINSFKCDNKLRVSNYDDIYYASLSVNRTKLKRNQNDDDDEQKKSNNGARNKNMLNSTETYFVHANVM